MASDKQSVEHWEHESYESIVAQCVVGAEYKQFRVVIWTAYMGTDGYMWEPTVTEEAPDNCEYVVQTMEGGDVVNETFCDRFDVALDEMRMEMKELREER